MQHSNSRALSCRMQSRELGILDSFFIFPYKSRDHHVAFQKKKNEIAKGDGLILFFPI